MTPEVSPPVATPQLSPDGQWVWDGTQWRPVARREAAFAAFKRAGEGVRTSEAVMPTLRPATPSPLMQAPAWGKGKASKAGIPSYAYIGGGAVAALIIVALILSVLPRVFAPAKQAATTPVATPSAAPGPATRSAAAEAAYIVSALTPHIGDVSDSVAGMRGVCRAGMTSSCEDVLLTANGVFSPLVPILQHALVPPCVAAQVGRMLGDLNATNTGVQLALKAFKDNKKTEFTSGMGTANKHAALLNAEFVAIRNAVASCTTDVVGP